MTLVDPAGQPVPEWQPGAHIELQLPSGKIRHYSLCGDATDTSAFTIAVQHEPEGRGGSHELHSNATVGQLLRARGPRNRFALAAAPHHLLIAGGIGVTPILPMARELARNQTEWQVLYCGHHDDMAFVDELRRIDRRRVTIRATDREGRPDLGTLIAALPRGATVYCCGPPTLLADVATHCASRADVVLCAERFAADPAAVAIEGITSAIAVELVVTGTTITVPPDKTILDAVREVRPDIPSSCEEGYCGTCETRVLSGVPEHRDTVLGKAERAANNKMMICVSRAVSPHLALDL